MIRPWWHAVILLGVSVSWTTPAYAYLDPGTGSIMLQVVLGGLAGALVAAKLYWHKLKQLFSRGRTEKASDAAGKTSGKPR